MEPTALQAIRKRIGEMEIYGRREDLLRALDRGDSAGAAVLCAEAMKEAAYRARYNCAPIGPAEHKRNFEALKELRSEIRGLSRPALAGQVAAPPLGEGVQDDHHSQNHRQTGDG